MPTSLLWSDSGSDNMGLTFPVLHWVWDHGPWVLPLVKRVSLGGLPLYCVAPIWLKHTVHWRKKQTICQVSSKLPLKKCGILILTTFCSFKRWFRSSRIWQYYCDFYPIKLIKTADLDPGRSYLMGSHPHGLLCSGAFGVFATDKVGFEEAYPGFNRNLLTLQGECLSLYTTKLSWFLRF